MQNSIKNSLENKTGNMIKKTATCEPGGFVLRPYPDQSKPVTPCDIDSFFNGDVTPTLQRNQNV